MLLSPIAEIKHDQKSLCNDNREPGGLSSSSATDDAGNEADQPHDTESSGNTRHISFSFLISLQSTESGWSASGSGRYCGSSQCHECDVQFQQPNSLRW